MNKNQEENKQKDKKSLTFSAPEEVAGEPIFTGVQDMKAAGAKRAIHARKPENPAVHVHFEHGSMGAAIEHDMHVKNPELLAFVRCQTPKKVASTAGQQVGAGKVVHSSGLVKNSGELEYTSNKPFHVIKPRKSNESLKSDSSSGHSQEVSEGVTITDKGNRLKIRKPGRG
ncbi:hypothetical protein [Abyssalbus ytuae]|uniref:Uncharacterized protein n=1 Tax=Abyssalbus ytuae TaxID=2926907 RepID=A0A9E6ZWU8_9FLAO|nr:hypothetical protein [Abyssalbus ytuae]UOB16657.1 hypothetical protein MQE35_13035 [Abyssalbus ytuae]